MALPTVTLVAATFKNGSPKFNFCDVPGISALTALDTAGLNDMRLLQLELNFVHSRNMAPRPNDNVLWLGIGFFAIRAAAEQLQRVRTVTEVTHVEEQARVISQETEDALKFETLRKLAEGPNFDLRAASLKIISERSVKGPTYDLLLRNLTGKHPGRRNSALVALKFLSSSSAADSISNFKTYNALIDCLCNLIPEHVPTPRTEYRCASQSRRPQAERTALVILCRLLQDNIFDAVRAGIVSRWLSKYPFGGSTTDEARRREVVQQLKTFNSDDALMCEVIVRLDNLAEGRKQLRKCGLTGSAIGENDDREGDIWMVDGDDTAGGGPGLGAGGRRVREESADEQALRRRRREAMVFSEGGGPLGRENIIQRDEVARDDEVERELEQLMEEVNREDDEADDHVVAASSLQGWSAWRPWPLRPHEVQ
ncbi:MAG: hypothetical protein M1830_002192 [Pleopsidium flavum]|nr:MAG: hypothetical protein M1830_002192 [Pleopsidium flavum]